MVDFQSRDSRPTFGGDDEEDDEGESNATEDAAEAETAADAEQEADAGESPVGETAATVGETPAEDIVSTTEGDGGSSTVDTGPGAPAETTEEGTETSPDAGAGATDGAVGAAVVTVDGELAVEDDRAGQTALEVLGEQECDVATREVIAADYDNVQQTLGGLAVRDDVDLVVTLGGDGVGPDEVTVDAARALFDQELPAFGELFRSLARESVGTGVLHTRACAGVMDGIPVFCLPASADAARLGLEGIVLPELERLLADLRD